MYWSCRRPSIPFFAPADGAGSALCATGPGRRMMKTRPTRGPARRVYGPNSLARGKGLRGPAHRIAMSRHRFREQLSGPGPGAVASGSAASSPGFAPVPVAVAMPAAMAEVYRLAYEAALARIAARRRCFAPFSLN